jgi:stage V sporulation protein S
MKKSLKALKVASSSNPSSVAGAIAAVMKESDSTEIFAIGGGAVNQAVKSIAIARGFLAPSGIDIICIPAFSMTTIDGEERTAIKLIVQKR